MIDHKIRYISNIYDKRWGSFILDEVLRVSGELIYSALSLKKEYSISLNFVNDDKIRKINKKHRKKDKTTNVISLAYFNKSDLPNVYGHMILGDIFFSFDTLQEEAKNFNIQFVDYFIHLLIHGTLHVFGFDHDTDENAKEMELLEGNIMHSMGKRNPYESYML